MNVDLSGEVLTGQDIGFTVVLRTSGGYTITIESRLTVESPTGTVQASPGPDTEADLSVHLGPLADHRITTADADTAGGLDIEFDGGTRLHVDPDENYEAWTINGPDGQLIVSGPGGGLTEWPGDRQR
jgi:hypothetical protein